MVFATTCCGLFDHHGTNVCAGGLRVVLGNEMSRARAVLCSRMSSEAEELSDAGQGAISAEESLSDRSGRDEAVRSF